MAAALLLWSRRNSGKRLWRPIAPKIGSPALFAIAAGLVGLGVGFTWALYPAAFWLAVLGARQWWRERAAMQRRLPPRHPATPAGPDAPPETLKSPTTPVATTHVIGPTP